MRDGRLLYIDRDNVLHCLDEANGHEFWQMPLGAAAVGPPVIEHRNVRIATSDGRVAFVDAIDGRVGNALRCPAGISTRVAHQNGVLWFGAADGRVRAVDESSGRALWAIDVGRPLADGELVLARTGVLALGSDQRLVRLDRVGGQQLAVTELPAASVLQSMRVRGNQLVTVVRFPREGQRQAHDLLQARDIETLALLWEYEDEGMFTGAPSVDGAFVAVAGSDGDVVLLR